MKRHLATVFLILTVLAGTTQGYSQNWSFGANMGMSFLAGSAGFHLTPMAELLLNRNIGIGSEFSVNTQYSSPIIWYPYFKYYFTVHGSGLRPYADAGPVLAFHFSDSPSFGILFGGGVNIPLAGRVYLAPDVLLGPVFNAGGGTNGFLAFQNFYGMGVYNLLTYNVPGRTVFVFTVRGGIRYEL